MGIVTFQRRLNLKYVNCYRIGNDYPASIINKIEPGGLKVEKGMTDQSCEKERYFAMLFIRKILL